MRKQKLLSFNIIIKYGGIKMGLTKDLDVLQAFCEDEYKAKGISFKDYQSVKKSVANIKNTLNIFGK